MRFSDGLSVGEADGDAVGGEPLVVAGCIRPKKMAGTSGVGDSTRGA